MKAPLTDRKVLTIRARLIALQLLDSDLPRDKRIAAAVDQITWLASAMYIEGRKERDHE